MMHSHTYFRALHIPSVSLVEGSLSSKVYISLAAANVVVTIIKLVGWLGQHNRRIFQLVISLASVLASVSILIVASLKETDHDIKPQEAYLCLLIASCVLSVIYEVESLLSIQQDSGRWEHWKQWSTFVMLITMFILIPLVFIGLCVSISRGADLSLISKILLSSTSAEYFLLSIGHLCLFAGVKSLGWKKKWHFFAHPLLCLLISVISGVLFREAWADPIDGGLVLFGWILFTLSNTCALRVLVRQATKSTPFVKFLSSSRQRLKSFLKPLGQYLESRLRYLSSSRQCLPSFLQYSDGFRKAPDIDIEGQHSEPQKTLASPGTRSSRMPDVEIVCQQSEQQDTPVSLETSGTTNYHSEEQSTSVLPCTPEVDSGGQYSKGSLELCRMPDSGVGRQYIKDGDRILLDQTYDFELYTLVRLSGLGNNPIGKIFETLDRLGTLNEILSTEDLLDASWELPVLKSYLPQLEGKLRQIFPSCNIQPDNDPTEPNLLQVTLLGYTQAKLLEIGAFCERAERMKKEALPQAAAYYSHLLDKVVVQSSN